MTPTHSGRPLRAALAALAAALVCVAFAATATVASAAHAKKPYERLVVRGEDTVKDGPCPTGVCSLQLTGGAFRGTLGTGGYDGGMKLHVADNFPNGEGGLCAPVDGTIVLGAGTPDRLVLAVRGSSCQDGKGDVTMSSFTGVMRWVVKDGSGAYANATGRGLMSSFEDAADHEHMTLIGRITR